MSEELEKIARKRSSDSVQESLRAAKDAWNQDVKLLIAGLIAFKRGMNGRGDPKANLPPSSIKDPLPPQIGQYLSNIASQYSKIIDEAKKIIDAQAYYSAHRRKPKPKQQDSTQSTEIAPKTSFILEPSLIVQGSWWGSRAWAYFSLLRNIDKYNRRLRLGMLNSALELNKNLKGFEYKVAEREVNSAPIALTILSSVSSEYLGVFLHMFDKLQEIYQTKEKVEQKVDQKTDKPDVKERKLSLEERKLFLQEKKIEEQKRKQKEEVPEISETQINSGIIDFWEEFKKIYSQLVKIEVVLKHIFSLPNVDKTNFKTMKQAFDKFSRDVSILYDLSKRSDHDKSAVELERFTQDIINQYKYLLQTSTAILGPASNFDELVTRIPKPKVSAYLEILQNQDFLKKEAANAVSNWLNKMWMNINPDNIDRMKLEMIDSSASLRQSIDKLMNALEDKEAKLDILSVNVSEVSKKFVDLLDQGISLAKNYMIAARRQEKGKNYYLADIRQSDIKVLNDLRNDIANYIKS